MNKINILVPAGIRYISDWPNFTLPDHPAIIDKQLPGCGFTEYCITNKENVILCSPRKFLLENKTAQHPGDVLYVNPSIIGLENQEVDMLDRVPPEYPDLIQLGNLQRLIYNYIVKCRKNHKPIKILVTYDSFKYVKQVLMALKENADNYYIVVDEFQSVFTDSSFKPDTELEFINELKGINHVCFVSATPMMENYLDRVDEFKTLPYYAMDWEKLQPIRVNRPFIATHPVNSVISAGVRLIEKYKAGEIEGTYVKDEDGNVYQKRAEEIVFYVNSVSNIVKLIKKTGLRPDEVNILCARTKKNEDFIRNNLSGWYKIGIIPLKGEKRKMFTFCTRTTYFGADFYSDCAKTIILSDANVGCTAVDIALDIPQIMGRQRLKENPWRNQADLYYVKSHKKYTTDEINKKVEGKIEKSNLILDSYKSIKNPNTDIEEYLKGLIRDSIKNNAYQKDYVGLQENQDGTVDLIFNNLAMFAEIRSYSVVLADYTNPLQFSEANLTTSTSKVPELLSKLSMTQYFQDKLKLVCEYKPLLTDIEWDEFLDHHVPAKLRSIIVQAGVEVCTQCGYNITRIKEVAVIKESRDLIIEKLREKLSPGNSYTATEVKNILEGIYKELRITNIPVKAADLIGYLNGNVSVKRKLDQFGRKQQYFTIL
jgi:hypothetical protein